MTQDEINKYITEKVLGECWHDVFHPEQGKETHVCQKCNRCYNNTLSANLDFSQWEHYGPMIRKCMEKGWWGEFRDEFLFRKYWEDSTIDKQSGSTGIDYFLLNPVLGSAAIVEFLKGAK